MKQGEPCPDCGVPVYAKAEFSIPGGCFTALFTALRSVVTVARGGVGTIQFGQVPTKPVMARCINCGREALIEP